MTVEGVEGVVVTVDWAVGDQVVSTSITVDQSPERPLGRSVATLTQHNPVVCGHVGEEREREREMHQRVRQPSLPRSSPAATGHPTTTTTPFAQLCFSP